MCRTEALGLNGQAQTHGVENRPETAQGRVAVSRERSVNLRGIELRLICDGLHSATRLGKLAQYQQQFGLIAISQNG